MADKINFSNLFSDKACSSNLQVSSHSPVNRTEKENSIYAGFKLLTMNSKFITNFKTEYSLPSHVTSSSSKCSMSQPVTNFIQKNLKRTCLFRRKRLRTHPYDNNINNSYTNYLNVCGSDSMPKEPVSNNYRLRTTSLSSGTCGSKRPGAVCSPVNVQGKINTIDGEMPVTRSRSMEDLTGMSLCVPLSDRTKDVDNVSRAIQQMCVQDTS